MNSLKIKTKVKHPRSFTRNFKILLKIIVYDIRVNTRTSKYKKNKINLRLEPLSKLLNFESRYGQNKSGYLL